MRVGKAESCLADGTLNFCECSRKVGLVVPIAVYASSESQGDSEGKDNRGQGRELHSEPPFRNLDDGADSEASRLWG